MERKRLQEGKLHFPDIGRGLTEEIAAGNSPVRDDRQAYRRRHGRDIADGDQTVGGVCNQHDNVGARGFQGGELFGHVPHAAVEPLDTGQFQSELVCRLGHRLFVRPAPAGAPQQQSGTPVALVAGRTDQKTAGMFVPDGDAKYEIGAVPVGDNGRSRRPGTEIDDLVAMNGFELFHRDRRMDPADDRHQVRHAGECVHVVYAARRVRPVIADNNFQRPAENAAAGVDFRDCNLGAAVDCLAALCVAAGHIGIEPDQNRPITRRCFLTCETHRKKQSSGDCQYPFFRRHGRVSSCRVCGSVASNSGSKRLIFCVIPSYYYLEWLYFYDTGHRLTVSEPRRPGRGKFAETETIPAYSTGGGASGPESAGIARQRPTLPLPHPYESWETRSGPVHPLYRPILPAPPR